MNNREGTMKDNILYSCLHCNITPTRQSLRKCPKCGRELTKCNLNDMPIERKPEWPSKAKIDN